MIIKAYAKINLSLDVVGKREDGYHLLRTVMQSVSLYDEIEMHRLDSGIQFDCSDKGLLGDDNLVLRAARLYFEETALKGVIGGVSIYLDKRIPLTAGLGGGSTDAAAVLIGLNKMYGNVLSDQELSKLALSLGADVPFCLYGGTALATGVGEILEHVSSSLQCSIVIAKRGNKGSTGEMYKRLDSITVKHPDTEMVVSGIINGDVTELSKGAYNCFIQVCDSSDLDVFKSVAEENGALYCGLSGAGPSVFALFEQQEQARGVLKSLEELGFEVYFCEPVLKANEIIE